MQDDAVVTLDLEHQTVHPRPVSHDDLNKIIDLAKRIEEAVYTVEQNEDVCDQIGRRASSVVAMLSWFTSTKTTLPLGAMEEILGDALRLVTACSQGKNSSTCLIFPAGKKLSRELRQVDLNMRLMNQYIVDQMGVANDAPKTITPQYLYGTEMVQDPELVGSSPSGHFIVDTRGRYEVNAKEVSRDAPPFSVGFKFFSLSELETATNNFSEENLIGKSVYAVVYKGELLDGRVVVVKRYEPAGTRFPENYAHIFSVPLVHSNLAGFVGIHQKVTKQLLPRNGRYVAVDVHNSLVVEEFMPNGSLQRFIDGRSPQMQDWPSTFRIIRGIAEGVAYLHSNHVIHLDLKPQRIFLDSNMNPKIRGFEISKKLEQDQTEARTDDLVGTRHYMAPEYVRSGVVSVKNDTYAFGVLLLATVSGISKSGLQEDPLHWASSNKAWEAQDDLSDPSLYSQPELNEIKRCIEIGLACTQVNQNQRPTMPEVIEMLNSGEKLPSLERNKDDDAPETSVKATPFSFSALEIATNNFSKDNLIAKGRVATIYKGILPHGVVVAIKIFSGPLGKKILKQYLDVSNELHQHGPHKNVVRLLGYCDEQDRETVVEEYMPSRSLSKIMDESPHKLDLNWAARFQIILGIAHGVHHLHAKGILHFDLTPANIVIFDERMNPKICDFGLSKMLNEPDSETGTEGFAAGSKAPEYNDGIISVKNDVYSFGDLLRTFCGMSRPGPPKDLDDLARVVQEARRMKEFFDPSSCKPSELKQIKRCMDIALLCTQMEPRDRPTMKRTLRLLSSNRKVPAPRRNKASSSKKRYRAL